MMKQPSLFDQDYGGGGLKPLKTKGINPSSQGDAVVLYTPNTGLPDLELKIAYGLARVAFEAGLEFEVKRFGDGFLLKARGSLEDLERTWEGLLRRMMSYPEFFASLPGLGQLRHASGLVYQGESASLEAYLRTPQRKPYKASTSSLLCGHPLERDNKSTAYLFLSFLISKVLPRDGGWSNRSNLGICKTCARLASLGYYSAALQLWTDRTLIVLPVPREGFSKQDFVQMIAAQREVKAQQSAGTKRLRGADKVGIRELPVLIFAQYPHLADFYLKGNFDMALYVLEKGQAWNTRDAWSGDVEPYAKFVKGGKGAYNPFNVALIHRLTWNMDDAQRAFPYLSRALASQNLGERRYYAASFSREAVKALSKNTQKVQLLNKNVAEYLLKEVAMIKPELYRDEAVRAFAGLLRYFVNQRNFSFVDRLRSTKEGTHEFEEVIGTMMRQARVASEEGAFIPGPEKVARLMQLAKEDFEALKHALVILGLSWGGVKEVSND